jgi:plasmid stabilization system protein ParE
MKAVRFHPDAESEMIEAAAYYEAQQSDLGRRFLASVQDAVSRISANPRLYAVVDLNVRRCLTKTFPFGVLFRERPEALVIMAVMNLHRDPDYWKKNR